MAGVTCPSCHSHFVESAERATTHLVECPQCRSRFPRPVEPGAGRVLAVAATILGLLLVFGGIAGWVVYRQYQRAHVQNSRRLADDPAGKDAQPARQP